VGYSVDSSKRNGREDEGWAQSGGGGGRIYREGGREGGTEGGREWGESRSGRLGKRGLGTQWRRRRHLGREGGRGGCVGSAVGGNLC